MGKDSIGKSEYSTQKDVIDFFVNALGYEYKGNLKNSINFNIDEEKLYAYLTDIAGYSMDLAVPAIEKLRSATMDMSKGLYAANKEVYSLLRYGAKIKENPDSQETTVYFIDYSKDGYKNNIYSIAEEVTVKESIEKRPDIVLYINGIAVTVLELKNSRNSVALGIRQNLTNQKTMFIESFFTTVQFLLAGNESEGLRFGTLLTPEKHYYEWKEDGYKENINEKDDNDIRIEKETKLIDNKLLFGLYHLCDKWRITNLIQNFIVFDNGVKKVCRYNQYYGIMRARKRAISKKNGIIWHTQGSGKTLTMIWLSKWIISNIDNSRVLIVTDREELDDQIEKKYRGVNEKIVRTKSCKDLIDRLNKSEDNLMCSLVHKFGKRGGEATEKDYDKYIEELKLSLPDGFKAKDNIFVFVDECHRTQSGKLNLAMKTIMPEATFFGFTGTPLLKKDKKTSLEVFGSFIHTYKFDEAVNDNVVLDLRYEARNIPQEVVSKEKIDKWFDNKTSGLNAKAKAKLKERWGSLQKLYSSKGRLEKIVTDIIFDFSDKPRLVENNSKVGAGNAVLVCESIGTACKYYDLFIANDFKKCAVITSYVPDYSELRTDTVSADEDTDTYKKYMTYLSMCGVDIKDAGDRTGISKKIEDFETEAKRKFVEEPNNMKLLIVVDKLLTGFDAPSCTYLYIDKQMHDHGLFQAVCRVNRIDDDTKDFGYIVDYKESFKDLKNAIDVYTSGAFAAYDSKDVEGLLKDRKVESKKYFNKTLEELEGLIKDVLPPKKEIDYIHYFCGDGSSSDNEVLVKAREKLYYLTSRLIRAHAEYKSYYIDLNISDSEKKYNEERVTFFHNLKMTIGYASGDFIDLKSYEPGMRYLIDTYIDASDSEVIGNFDEYSLLDFVKNKGKDATDNPGRRDTSSEAIENNIRKKIVEKMLVNPKYYSKMSKVLTDLIAERKKGTEDYKELLEKYIELAKNVSKPEENDIYPEKIRKSMALMSLYDNLDENEDLAKKIHDAVLSSRQDGFRNDFVKENRIKREIYKILNDKDEVERIFKVIIMQEEY